MRGLGPHADVVDICSRLAIGTWADMQGNGLDHDQTEALEHRQEPGQLDAALAVAPDAKQGALIGRGSHHEPVGPTEHQTKGPGPDRLGPAGLALLGLPAQGRQLADVAGCFRRRRLVTVRSGGPAGKARRPRCPIRRRRAGKPAPSPTAIPR